MRVDGEVGAACVKDGRISSVLSFVTDGDRICRIYAIRNPETLAGTLLSPVPSYLTVSPCGASTRFHCPSRCTLAIAGWPE